MSYFTVNVDTQNCPHHLHAMSGSLLYSSLSHGCDDEILSTVFAADWISRVLLIHSHDRHVNTLTLNLNTVSK
jgi:hypothetical protein